MAITPSRSLSHPSRMWSRTVWLRAAVDGSIASLSSIPPDSKTIGWRKRVRQNGSEDLRWRKAGPGQAA